MLSARACSSCAASLRSPGSGREITDPLHVRGTRHPCISSRVFESGIVPDLTHENRRCRLDKAYDDEIASEMRVYSALGGGPLVLRPAVGYEIVSR